MPQFAHIAGKSNKAADALSRNITPVCSVTTDTSFDTLSHADIMKAQHSDPTWSKVLYFLESDDDSALPQVPSLTHYLLQDNLLYKATTLTGKHEPSRLIHQLAIPQTLVPSILRLIHDTPHASHPGKEKTLSQARLKYFWLSVRKDINAHVDVCHTCCSTKGTIHAPVPMLNYPTPAGPWDAIAIDLLKLSITQNGNQYLFVANDHFSRFSVLVPLPDKSAQTVAGALLDNVICPFTTPKVLLFGKEFINDVFQSLCQLFRIKKCNILPYRPSANGLIERHDRKILNTLRSLIPDNDTLWDTYTPQVMASLNSTITHAFSSPLPFPKLKCYYAMTNQPQISQSTLEILFTQSRMSKHKNSTPILKALSESLPKKQATKSDFSIF